MIDKIDVEDIQIDNNRKIKLLKLLQEQTNLINDDVLGVKNFPNQRSERMNRLYYDAEITSDKIDALLTSTIELLQHQNDHLEDLANANKKLIETNKSKDK